LALSPKRLVKPLKKLRNLFDDLGSEPTPEQVHHLRTNARRFEAAFETLAVDDVRMPHSFLKDLARLRKRAGEVRDMDVLTQYAAAIRPHGEEECQVRLLEHLGARRKKQAGKLSREIRKLGPALRRELDKAPSRIAKLLRNNDADATHNIAATMTARAVTLAAQLAEPLRLNRTNLHAYRLKVKELQNILLMAEAESRPRFVRDLGRVKDGIGEWHDYAELVAIGSKLLDHAGGCPLLAELKRTAESKYDDALALALRFRKLYLDDAYRPAKKGAATAGTPRAPVWEAMARLAG
jgi:CHAD domain-containing protein